jgi:hypothetical protein
MLFVFRFPGSICFLSLNVELFCLNKAELFQLINRNRFFYPDSLSLRDYFPFFECSFVVQCLLYQYNCSFEMNKVVLTLTFTYMIRRFLNQWILRLWKPCLIVLFLVVVVCLFAFVVVVFFNHALSATLMFGTCLACKDIQQTSL